MDIATYLNDLRVKENKVFDPIRKKWLIIQPEELVRQTLLLYLIHEKNISSARIAVEKAICVHRQVRRFDLVYYDKHGDPMLLVECKSPSIPLTQHVLEQAVWYNYEIKAPFLLLSNGQDLRWYKIDPDKKTYAILPKEGPVLS